MRVVLVLACVASGAAMFAWLFPVLPIAAGVAMAATGIAIGLVLADDSSDLSR